MIFEVLVDRDSSGGMVLRERPYLVSTVMDCIFGAFLMGVGLLVIGVFLSGNGPRPISGEGLGKLIAGWIVVWAFFTALGLFPFSWGFNAMFVRDRFALCEAGKVVEAQLTFLGIPFWTRRHGLGAFDRAEVRQRKLGVFGGSPRFIVACDGRRRVDLVAFPDVSEARALAADIGRLMGVPVVDTL